MVSTTRQSSVSPEKVETDLKPAIPHADAQLAVCEMEVINGLAQLQSGQAPIVDQRRVPFGGYNPDAYISGDIAGDPRGMQPGQQNKIGPSSYWSVQEVTIFPTYLQHFGTDWQAIATQMGTKTQTMVRMFFLAQQSWLTFRRLRTITTV